MGLPRPPGSPITIAVAESGGLGEAAAEEVVNFMDTEGFRDKADDALTQGEEEVDERTGGRFDEQTDRAADEVRERGEGILGDQQGDEPQQ
jgi:MT0933-like antitoxin protein